MFLPTGAWHRRRRRQRDLSSGAGIAYNGELVNMFLLFVREEEAALSLSVISLWDFHTGRTALFSTLLTTLLATHLATRIPWSEQRD